MTNILQHGRELTSHALGMLSQIHGVRIYGTEDASRRTSLAAFSVEGMASESVAYELNKKGIEARDGNHCASLAHEFMGIEDSVRLSCYVYNTKADVERAAYAVDEISREVREAGS